MGNEFNRPIKLLHYGVYGNRFNGELLNKYPLVLFDGFILVDDYRSRWYQRTTNQNDIDKLYMRMRDAKRAAGEKDIFYLLQLGPDGGDPFNWNGKILSEEDKRFLRLFADSAARAGLTGVCIDTEGYEEHMWNPLSDSFKGAHAPDKPYFSRLAGRDVAEQIWAYNETKHLELLVMHCGPYENIDNKDVYSLHPYFVVGMIEALYANDNARAQLHMLYESTYDGTINPNEYDTMIKDLYIRIKKNMERHAPDAVDQWCSYNCGIAAGAWPLGSFTERYSIVTKKNDKGKNFQHYGADAFGTQLQAFASHRKDLGDKYKTRDLPGSPKYAWVYGEEGAWLETDFAVVDDYYNKLAQLKYLFTQ